MAHERKGKRSGIDGAPVELFGRVSLDGRRGVWYARGHLLCAGRVGRVAVGCEKDPHHEPCDRYQ